MTPIIRPFSELSAEQQGEATSLVKPRRKQPGTSQALRELTKHKLAVGVVLEKTGCELVNKKRRQGFLDDEDFEDEVESEGVGAGHDDRE